MSLNLITATHLDFEPFVGKTFDAEIDDGKIELILDNIIIHEHLDMRDNHLEIEGVVYPPRQPFALTFQGPLEPILETKTYRVTHADTGTMHLFMSPFRQDSDCILYEVALS